MKDTNEPRPWGDAYEAKCRAVGLRTSGCEYNYNGPCLVPWYGPQWACACAREKAKQEAVDRLAWDCPAPRSEAPMTEDGKTLEEEAEDSTRMLEQALIMAIVALAFVVSHLLWHCL